MVVVQKSCVNLVWFVPCQKFHRLLCTTVIRECFIRATDGIQLELNQPTGDGFGAFLQRKMDCSSYRSLTISTRPLRSDVEVVEKAGRLDFALLLERPSSISSCASSLARYRSRIAPRPGGGMDVRCYCISHNAGGRVTDAWFFNVIHLNTSTTHARRRLKAS
jgi:hypothetical protein